MLFDERKLKRCHVMSAVNRFLREQPQHPPSRSTFLIFEGNKLPAKYILRLAYEELTGEFPKGEQITGGKASIRVLRKLGFETLYENTPKRQNRNPVKNLRRESFRKLIAEHWSEVKTEYKFEQIKVPDLENRSSMDTTLLNILETIESKRNIRVKGKKDYNLSCDFYLPEVKTVIEFDERQHFTLLRAASLEAYPPSIPLGFDLKKWIRLSNQINAGDNSPIYRDEQRAFYDSIRDIMAPQLGLRPVIRIFEEDVHWEKEGQNDSDGAIIIDEIRRIVEQTL